MSMRVRIFISLVVTVVLCWLLQALLQRWSQSQTSILLLQLVLLAAPLSWLSRVSLAPLSRVQRALQGLLLSYRDGEYNVSLVSNGDNAGRELKDLMRMHAELGRALREQRQHLTQRELLLDTVVQNTPVALVLSDTAERIVYANTAARQLLFQGRSLVGNDLQTVLATVPEPLKSAVLARQDALLRVEAGGDSDTFHLLQREFRLQGRPHRLRLLRRMTRELARQEVASWKRVIRVMSHELNNSLASISSLAHSGSELLRREDPHSASDVFTRIGERSARLHRFLAGYAVFAKLPAPHLAPVALAPFVENLAAHCRFTQEGALPPIEPRFDAGQLEQALINLLKNAHEAGGNPEAVTMRWLATKHELCVEVADRGAGMNESVLAQALLPFYSTKRSGSGLGLALAREIAEAHGGSLTIQNRRSGGVSVKLTLPL